jgi:hypothetical protein
VYPSLAKCFGSKNKWTTVWSLAKASKYVAGPKFSLALMQISENPKRETERQRDRHSTPIVVDRETMIC